MNEISTNLINKNKKENDISKLIINNSLNNSNILQDRKLNYYHQNLLSDTLPLNSKIIENEINSDIKDNSNSNNKGHQNIFSNEFLFTNSNISSLNHSFQILSKVDNQEKNKANELLGYATLSKNQYNNLNKRNYLNNKKTNKNSIAYKTSFNFRPSEITKKLLNDNEQLNQLYNYGESLTQKLKTSNDNNTDLLKKYINLKAELQIQENKNKELENKIKLLKEEEINIKKSNEELNQSILSVQKIINNNKLSYLKSISESEKHFNLNNDKIKDLNIRNKNLKKIRNEYDNEIKKLQNILNEYKRSNENFFVFDKYLENDNKPEKLNIQKDIDILKSENMSLQNELKKLKNFNEIII